MVISRWLLRLGKLLVSVTLLAGLWFAADWSTVVDKLGQLEPGNLVVALLLFIPQTIVSAWRWQRLARGCCSITLAEATRQTLAASAWNLIVPSKLGDFSKAACLPLDKPLSRAKASGLVMLEKLADLGCLLSVLAWGLTGVMGGLLFATVALAVWVRRSTPPYVEQRPRWWGPVLGVVAATVCLWLLHLTQLHLFLLSSGVDASWSTTAARMPVALLAGLAPVALWGLGTRDATLVWLYSDVASASTMAVVGMLTALRYLVPGAVGIPCLLMGRRMKPSPTPLDDPSTEIRRPSRPLGDTVPSRT